MIFSFFQSVMRGTRRRAPRTAGRRLAFAALGLPLLALLLPAATVSADTPPSSVLERRVKAAFLYKFLAYAEFPPQAFADGAAPLVIGVAGSDEMAAELARITAGRMINGRTILVRLFREQDAQTPVHLLFVAGSDPARVGRMMRAAPVMFLTVTECGNQQHCGSVINFRIVDERVRFDVSLDAAERNNVKLSSRLLTVANRVQKGAP
ncbi:YfiR family protein [Massilia sp. ST3]|uniref:YfiR family protein n=1 Tax=Massilia sp. ST3 TaxID=2824903 RepID=UPI001B81A51C|nr:YfiR family protein [Massilia sp. ST3]MBQ5947049.1 YfiR family protein [Massilia sp. ST3]